MVECLRPRGNPAHHPRCRRPQHQGRRNGQSHRRVIGLSDLPGFPQRSAAIRRATALLCLRLNWAPLHEVPLPNGRRADLLALRPDGGIACIEVKSGLRDFLTDRKWQEYRPYSDALFFAVDPDFPTNLLPEDAGLILAEGMDAEIARDAPAHPLAPARRRALLQRFATLAATRLAAREDPAGLASIRTALLVE